jgi:hypothetical protein
LLLGFIPLVHARAVRLTDRKYREVIPASINEMRAEKDHLCAEFAMSTKRPEIALEAAKAKATNQLYRGRQKIPRKSSSHEELSSSQAALLLAKIELSSSAAAEPIEKVEEPGDPKCDSLVAHPMPHFMPLKKAGPFARFAPALSSPKTAGVAQGHLARTCHGRWPFYSRRCFFCELPIFRSCSG